MVERELSGCPEDCLAGGGELGALMRSRDWSKSPLGPVASWPQSLRTSVSIMLASGFAVVVAWGPEFIFLYNDRYRPVLGVTKHPMALGSRAVDIFPEVWDMIGPLFRKATAGETVALDDVLIPLDRNGYLEECFFTLSYSPIRDESGGVGGMLAIVAETSERVQGERRLRTLRDLASVAPHAETAEQACENAARTLATSPADVPFALLYLLGADGARARLVSRAGLDDVGGDVVAPFIVLDQERPDQWPLARAAREARAVVVDDLVGRFGRLPGGAYPEPTHAALVLPLARPGLEHPYGFLVAGVSPRRALDDKYHGFFELAAEHVATAIANAVSREAERRRAEALAEIDRAKTTFFSNVSHEFRTPLTLMLAPLEDLLARDGASAELQLLQRNALRLLKLVNTLLDFSRIEAGRVQAAYEPTDLAALTRDLASSFRAAIDRASLELVIDCPPLPEPVYVDRDMWEKIVLNLLSNAFKFTFEGSIQVRLRAVDDHVEFDVADTGTGIADQDLPRLFERFHRIEGARSRSYEGSGIGLAFVHELARMHGGTVRVKSRLGEGTTFTVALPRGSRHLPQERVRGERTLASTALGAAPYVEEALRWLPGNAEAERIFEGSEQRLLDRASNPAQAGAAHASIVVVDDNADMRSYLARVLGELGDVRKFPDGAQALAGIRGALPDVVVSDVMMPNLDGLGLLHALRAEPRTAAIPVLLLSARAGESARIEGARSGADDYIVKPFSARELVARVGAQIDLAHVRGVALAERAKLHQLFMEAPAAIAILSGPNHVYELANPSYCQLVGRTPAQLLGRPGREALPELSEQGVWELFDRIRATGQRYEAAASPVMLNRRGDDRLDQGFFNWVGQPVRDAQGNVDGVLVFAVDITEQVVARERAEHLAAELDRVGRAKDEFVAMLGHELRNPLAPIVTALRVMELRGVVGGEKERAIVARQVQHLTRLVDDLLDVSRITSGKVQLSTSRIEISDVIARAVEVASPLLEQRGHHLTVSVPRSGHAVCVDPGRLAQVFSNLLTNACKYTDPGGHVSVTAEREGSWVAIRVRDSGVGIEPDMLPRVFDLFAQEPQSLDRARGGLGLGLAIVHSLVSLHGGSVDVDSGGRGQGAVFTVRLPLAGLADDPPHDVAEESHLRSPRAESRRVLIVDDNDDAAELLAELLAAHGHVTRIAHDGPAALAMLPEFAPHVALLDIGLPAMDGYELARRMRATAAGAKACIVAVTGYGQETDRRRSSEAGFDAHFVKPLDSDAIVRAVEAS